MSASTETSSAGTCFRPSTVSTLTLSTTVAVGESRTSMCRRSPRTAALPRARRGGRRQCQQPVRVDSDARRGGHPLRRHRIRSRPTPGRTCCPGVGRIRRNQLRARNLEAEQTRPDRSQIRLIHWSLGLSGLANSKWRESNLEAAPRDLYRSVATPPRPIGMTALLWRFTAVDFGRHAVDIRQSRGAAKDTTAYLQGFVDAGGGTRTPDTRIMIPLL
jgi:hypothetical protein